VKFSLDDAIPILSSTPAVLRTWLSALPDSWIRATEGPDTWSPYDIVGHLIHGERTDWMPRAEILLSHGEARPFTPFDRFAQFEASRGKTLQQLLGSFAELRQENLIRLKSLEFTPPIWSAAVVIRSWAPSPWASCWQRGLRTT